MNANENLDSNKSAKPIGSEKNIPKPTVPVEHRKMCKEIGELLARVGDEFEQWFLSRPVAVLQKPMQKKNSSC